MFTFEQLGTAFAIRSYFKTLKDYFDPIIQKTKKRIQKEYFIYDMESEGDLSFWRDVLKNDFYNPTTKTSSYGGFNRINKF
jgi:abortive infection bacteriophage resistance protein